MQELLEEREAWLEQRKGLVREDVKVGRIEAVRQNDQLQLLERSVFEHGNGSKSHGNLLHWVLQIARGWENQQNRLWEKRNDRKVLRGRHRRGIFHVLAVR